MATAADGALTVERSVEEAATLLEVEGELDIATAPRLCLAIEVDDSLIVDLRGVSFCDVAGLRALACAAREVEIQGGQIVLVAGRDGAVERLLAITGMGEFLRVVDTLEQAREAIRAPRLRAAMVAPAG